MPTVLLFCFLQKLKLWANVLKVIKAVKAGKAAKLQAAISANFKRAMPIQNPLILGSRS